MKADYKTIPKVLAAREEMEYRQKIPKIIWQTMKTNQVPAVLKDYTDTWIDKNPEYEYRFFDNEDIIAFIESDFPDYLGAYKKIKYGASKADLWRYLIMYKYGGVYADMDCRCINPLRQWIDPESTYVTQLGINKDLCQWLIISVPQNLLFLKAAHKVLQNLEQNKSYAEYNGFVINEGRLSIDKNEQIIKVHDKVFGLAGSPVLQETAEACLKEGSIAEILEFAQIVCVSGAKSCQMNGNVAHDCGHPEYIKAIGKLKSPSYNRFISRMMRRFFTILERI